MSNRFTAIQDQRIREQWPAITALAVEMDRPRSALSQRGRKIGLPRQVTHRRFSKSQLQMIVDRYPTEGPQQLARELNRSVGTLVNVAQRLGVATFRHWAASEDIRVVELRSQGKSYQQIAQILNRSVTACSKRAQDLGLSVRHYDPAELRERYLQPRTRKSIGPESRWARARIALGEHGWPPDLNPKEIAILESLLLRGPQERKILAMSIGEPPERNPKKFLTTHGSLSAIARIMTRGLVARLRLRRGRHMICVYALTATAVASKGTYPSVNEYNAAFAAAPSQSRKRERRTVIA